MNGPRPSYTDLLPFLHRVPFLAGLDDSALAPLARASRLKRLARGETLFQQGDSSDSAYIVRTGAVAIVLITHDGRELAINEMKPGDCFGELSLLTGLPRSAGAVAWVSSELVVIPRQEFLVELEREPALTRRLLETLAMQLQISAEREGILAFVEAPGRLARVLVRMERTEGGKGYVKISQEELAQRVGVTRQTAARVLGQWRRAGWIITGRGVIMLVDRPALRRCAGDVSVGR